MVPYSVWQSQRKHHGPEWLCHRCGLSFPSAGFGIDRHDRQTLHSACVAIGLWKLCIDCSEVCMEVAASQSRVCARCHQQQHHAYFVGDPNLCAACKLNVTFRFDSCSVYGKMQSIGDIHERVLGEQNCVCFFCEASMCFPNAQSASLRKRRRPFVHRHRI